MRSLVLFQRCAAYLLVILTAMPFTASLAVCPLTDLLAAAKSVRLVSRAAVTADLQRSTLDAGPSGALVTARQDCDLAALTDIAVPHPGDRGKPMRERGAHGGPRRSEPPLIPLRI